MSGDEVKSLELLRELKRTEGSVTIPRYASDTIDRTISEINSLYRRIQEIIAEDPQRILNDPYYSCETSVLLATAKRQKRILLAYLMERAQRLQRIRWELGSVPPEDVKVNMSEFEIEFYREYDDILGTYMTSIGLDVTADLTPPTDLYIEVRVLEDFGEIYTANGVVNLEKNTTHFLPRSDVESLIRRGILEHLV